MNKKEIFLKFCKINGITPLVMAGFYKKKPQLWIFHKESGNYFLETVHFNEFFNCLSRTNNFSWLFGKLSSKIFSREYRNSKDYEKLSRKWNYFVNKNVFIQEDSLKVGDKVLITDWDSTKEGEVKGLLINSDSVKISYFNEMYNRTCELIRPFNTIVEINGKKPDIKYYIKYKGKTYGTNS